MKTRRFIVVLSFFAGSIILLISCVLNSKNSNEKISNSLSKQKHDTIDFVKTSKVMEESVYWEIIDKSFFQSSSLLNELLKLTPKEIIGFELQTGRLLKQSYLSDLWCAAYIMKGGCSDDAFQYFRCWLITKGKDTYYKAIKNPDSLSELDRKLFSDYEFEELLYVTYDAFLNKTGKEIYDYIDLDKEGAYPEMKFTWQEENEESMKAICPKLFSKY